MAAVRAVVESLRGEIEAIERALDYVSGTGGNAGQVFYRSPAVSMFKVCFPNGRRTPPHDHGTWATILLLSGGEKNTLYRSENGKLRKAGEVTLEPVYGGDIFTLPRRMWNPETLEEHKLDWTLYEQFAQVASRAAGAPAT
jgi:predicted metal-dependent enzyme (double-stranded beta helix superfamily)